MSRNQLSRRTTAESTPIPVMSGRGSAGTRSLTHRGPPRNQSLTYGRLCRGDFDELAAEHPDVIIPLEQTPDWMEFEQALGRTPLGIWAYRDAEGNVVATASFIHLARRFRQSVVAVNGPVWFADRTPAAEHLLMETVRGQFRQAAVANPLYVRMQVATFQPPAAHPIEHGWYEREIVVDLVPAEEEILGNFGSNARNRIGRARRNGVEVSHVPRRQWREVFAKELFPIMEETAERGGFQSFDSHYYETLLSVLGDRLRLLVAHRQGVTLSWLITTEYRKHSVYYFAASTHEARTSFAPYLLLWEALKALKSAGNRACSLTGIESENYPSLANVTAFKKNFSRNVEVVPTTYDIPLSPVRYAVVATLLRARRGAPELARTALRRSSALIARRGTA